MKRHVTFIHTSPAAIPPLSDYYRLYAQDLEITNLLDDGILRYFARQMESAAEARFTEMLCSARDNYNAELALVTCSSVSRSVIHRLADAIGLPIVKIDDALAHQAVTTGSKLGVLVTFPPTQAVTAKLLRETAADHGVEVDLTLRVLPEAYEALLNGHAERHDELMLQAVRELAEKPLDAIVFAQVSMARLLPKLPHLPMPVLSSLPASLSAIRQALPAAAAAR